MADTATTAAAAAAADPMDVSQPLQFDATTIQKLHPQDYYRLFISQNVRPDARALPQFRPVQIVKGNISTANGSALVRLGNSAVICAVKAEVAVPDPLTPQEGFFVPNVELPAMCSPQFKPGPPSAKAQTLSENLHQLLLKSKFLDRKQLCISPGQAAWVLYADIYCINYDGNIFDAALTALMAALTNANIPEAEFNEEEGAVRASKLKTHKLKLERMPLAASFIAFESRLLADPTAEEETLMDTQVTIVFDEQKKLAGVLKSGGAPLTPEQMQECMQRAQHQYGVLRDLIL
ncbi:hypothetical protein RI367_000684 [Sorochytrium milnesiophthora]